MGNIKDMIRMFKNDDDDLCMGNLESLLGEYFETYYKIFDKLSDDATVSNDVYVGNIYKFSPEPDVETYAVVTHTMRDELVLLALETDIFNQIHAGDVTMIPISDMDNAVYVCSYAEFMIEGTEARDVILLGLRKAYLQKELLKTDKQLKEIQ